MPHAFRAWRTLVVYSLSLSRTPHHWSDKSKKHKACGRSSTPFRDLWVPVSEVARVLWVDAVVRRAAHEKPRFSVRVGEEVWIRAVGYTTSEPVAAQAEGRSEYGVLVAYAYFDALYGSPDMWPTPVGVGPSAPVGAGSHAVVSRDVILQERRDRWSDVSEWRGVVCRRGPGRAGPWAARSPADCGVASGVVGPLGGVRMVKSSGARRGSRACHGGRSSLSP